MIDASPIRKRGRWAAVCLFVSALALTLLQPVGASAAQTVPPVATPLVAAPSSPTAAPTAAVAPPKVLWNVVPYHARGGVDGEDGKVAMEAFIRGDYDLAIAAFSYCVQIRPNFADAHFNLGLCFEAVKDYDRAVVAFAAVIRMKPKLVDAYFELGRTYLLKGDLMKARETADAALKFKPEHEDAIALNADIAAASKFHR